MSTMQITGLENWDWSPADAECQIQTTDIGLAWNHTDSERVAEQAEIREINLHTTCSNRTYTWDAMDEPKVCGAMTEFRCGKCGARTCATCNTNHEDSCA